MPRRKASEAQPVESSEVKSAPEPKKRKAAAPRSAAAPHRHTAKKAAKTVNEPATAPAIGREEIATLAYSYWEARGYQGGSSDEDWYRAEQELLELAQDR